MSSGLYDLERIDDQAGTGETRRDASNDRVIEGIERVEVRLGSWSESRPIRAAGTARRRRQPHAAQVGWVRRLVLRNRVGPHNR